MRNCDIFSESRNERATMRLAMLLRKHHSTAAPRVRGRKRPVKVPPDPAIAIANYRAAQADLQAKLRRCSTPFQKVRATVCYEFGLTPDQLVAKGRNHAVPRQVAMRLLAQITGSNTRAVARLFNRDHTCVYQAKETISKKLQEDAFLAARVARIEEIILQAA